MARDEGPGDPHGSREGARAEPGEPVEIAPGVSQLDLRTGGSSGFNAAFVLTGREPTLVETGSGADVERLVAGLEASGVPPAALRHIVVTHIHLDHAGGAGALLEAAQGADVWVHERGAPHLADPTRLVASTSRTYGPERMAALFGATMPVPPERLRAMTDGDRIPIGDGSLEVLSTPGHASHHVALLDTRTGTMFTGEAIGSYLPDVRVYRPALPPPEVDVELALASIDRIAARGPTALATTHFGVAADVDRACERAAERIVTWSEAVRRVLAVDRGAEDDEISAVLDALAAEEFRADSGLPFDRDRYDVIGSIGMNAKGLARYWRKRWEREEARDEGRSGGTGAGPVTR